MDLSSKIWLILSLELFRISTAHSVAYSSSMTKFRDCLTQFSAGFLVERCTNGSYYAKLNHQWNLRKPHVYPLAYFVPETTFHVQQAVRCGYSSNIRLIPRSGGHSYESHSSGNAESVVIDFRRMNKVAIDVGEKTARIQPGAMVGSINLKLVEAGYGIPMGICHTVGIGGHALGGGLGYFSHLYGLTLDNVLELTMVDAHGLVHTVSKDQNPDLFWALLGVGPGYIGIVTEFKFKMFTAGSNIRITFAKINYDFAHADNAIAAWQDWLRWTKQHEPTVMAIMHIKGWTSKDWNLEEGIEIHTAHIQDKILQPKGNAKFLRNIDTIFFPSEGRNLTITQPTYYQLIMTTGYAPIVSKAGTLEIATDLTTLTTTTAFPRYNKMKSFFVNKWMDKAEIHKVGALIGRMPRRNLYISFTAEGGEISNVETTATAYVHRNFPYELSVRYEGRNDTEQVLEGAGYMDEFIRETKFLDAGETYQNFVDDDLNEDFMERYYGDNLEKLLDIKRAWDPHNYFIDKQSLKIGLA